MKSILLVIMFVLSVENYTQVAVTPSERGANEEFKKGQLENFKTTTTVFVLPETYKKEEYEKILKEVWTVTSFKVVDFKDFKHLDFVNGSYSFAEIFGDLLRTSSGTMYLHTNLGIKVLSKEKFEKEFRKLKTDDKNYDKKLRDVINESLSYVARIPLCPTNEFLRNALGSLDLMKLKFPEEKMGKLYGEMYAKVSFTNVNLGMLKNYFQQINQIITKGEHCGLYEDFVNAKIKNLKESILYIPEVYMMKYDAWRFSETLRDEKEIKKLLEDYKYKFQFIKDEDLEKKILDNEDIYYLRYVSMNGNKYLQIVNAKSGDPAYYIYDAMSYNLKDDDFKKINKAIEAK
ncbi:hypothetical protein [Flavobacterium salmonis]|uniref:Uncharacterized protein n=1 Tax=Flavobacterium salmonis TaxID=2654844 RepID=A0A6V6YUY6_9FLAO|nr:hypothetical protein [Flavobacterium salmonis]CAD0003348.1 hypothetical protein FLAT13_01630 [Flavobacterium salmonis]